MKLGVLIVLFQNKGLEEALYIVSDLGIEAAEIATGGYLRDAHCKPDKLLHDEGALKEFKETIERKDLMISALSCHGNSLHPDPEVRGLHHDAFRKTILLAEKLGVDRVNTFSGW